MDFDQDRLLSENRERREMMRRREFSDMEVTEDSSNKLFFLFLLLLVLETCCIAFSITSLIVVMDVYDRTKVSEHNTNTIITNIEVLTTKVTQIEYLLSTVIPSPPVVTRNVKPSTTTTMSTEDIRDNQKTDVDMPKGYGDDLERIVTRQSSNLLYTPPPSAYNRNTSTIGVYSHLNFLVSLDVLEQAEEIKVALIQLHLFLENALVAFEERQVTTQEIVVNTQYELQTVMTKVDYLYWASEASGNVTCANLSVQLSDSVNDILNSCFP